METLSCSPDALVSLESVLTTAELSRRPSRPPDYQAENQALVALAQELANSPSSMLVDTALELCRIAETDLPKIFQPFFTSKKRKGMGLGLPLCQRIVKNHAEKSKLKANRVKVRPSRSIFR